MRSTLIVRQIMQQHGKARIYTNKYDTCRTVKCYANNSGSDIAVIAAISAALNKHGIKFSAKTISRKPQFWGPNSSIIVRLPL